MRGQTLSCPEIHYSKCCGINRSLKSKVYLDYYPEPMVASDSEDELVWEVYIDCHH